MYGIEWYIYQPLSVGKKIQYINIVYLLRVLPMHDIWADRILKCNNKYIWTTCLSLVLHTHTFRFCGMSIHSHPHNILYLTSSCINLRFAPVLTTQRPTAFAVYTVSTYLYVCMHVCVSI